MAPAIYLMGSQLQYMGRCLGVIGTRGSMIPVLLGISVLNAFIAMFIMNIVC
jgi:spore maturation protein SpmB